MLWTFIKFFANLSFRVVLILTPKWPCLFSDNVHGTCILRNAITRFLMVSPNDSFSSLLLLIPLTFLTSSHKEPLKLWFLHMTFCLSLRKISWSLYEESRYLWDSLIAAVHTGM